MFQANHGKQMKNGRLVSQKKLQDIDCALKAIYQEPHGSCSISVPKFTLPKGLAVAAHSKIKQNLSQHNILPKFAGRYVTRMVSSSKLEVHKRFVKPSFGQCSTRADIEKMLRKLAHHKELKNLLLLITPTAMETTKVWKLHFFAMDTQKHLGVTNLTGEERQMIEKYHIPDSYRLIICSRTIGLEDVCRCSSLREQIFECSTERVSNTEPLVLNYKRLERQESESSKSNIVIKSLLEPKIPVRYCRLMQRQSQESSQTQSKSSSAYASTGKQSHSAGDSAGSSINKIAMHMRVLEEQKLLKQQQVHKQRQKNATKHKQEQLKSTNLDLRSQTVKGSESVSLSSGVIDDGLPLTRLEAVSKPVNINNINNFELSSTMDESKASSIIKILKTRINIIKIDDSQEEAQKQVETEARRRKLFKKPKSEKKVDLKTTRLPNKDKKESRAAESLQANVKEEHREVRKQKIEVRVLAERQVETSKYSPILDAPQRHASVISSVESSAQSTRKANEPESSRKCLAEPLLKKSPMPLKNAEIFIGDHQREQNNRFLECAENMPQKSTQQCTKSPRLLYFESMLSDRPLRATKSVQTVSTAPDVSDDEPLEPLTDRNRVKVLWKPQTLRKSTGIVATGSFSCIDHLPRLLHKDSSMAAITRRSSRSFEQLMLPVQTPADFSSRACLLLKERLKSLCFKRAFGRFGSLIDCINYSPKPLDAHLILFFKFAELLDMKLYVRQEVYFPGCMPTSEPRYRVECYMFEDRKDYCGSVALLVCQMEYFKRYFPKMMQNVHYIDDAFDLIALPLSLKARLKFVFTIFHVQGLYNLLAELIYAWLQPPATLLALTNKAKSSSTGIAAKE